MKRIEKMRAHVHSASRLADLRMRRLVLASRQERYNRLERDPHADPAEWAVIKANMEDLLDVERQIDRFVADRSCVSCDDPVFGINNPPDVGRYLYHYTSAAVLPKIRKSRSLRLGPLAAMNDPYEALDIHLQWFGLYGHEPLSPEEDERWRSTDWEAAINEYRREIKIGSYVEDRLPDLSLMDPHPPFSIAAQRILGHRGFAHPRMWAQYGARSAGVCLVLDFVALRDVFESSVPGGMVAGFGPVSYAEDPALAMPSIRTLLDRGPEGLLLERAEDLLLTKHRDWEHESEFRFFVADSSEPFFPIPIDNTVIVGLALGPKFDTRRHGRNVVPFCRDFRIRSRVCQVAWHCGNATLTKMVPPG
jgi:hypothetical protein